MLRFFSVLLLCGLFVSAFHTQAEELTNRAAPELVTYVKGILQSHPRVLAARSDVDAAAARTRGATRPLYNPEIEAEYEDAEERTRAIGISQTIDLGNKRAMREEIAAFEHRSTLEALSLIEQRVAAELLTTLGGFQVTEELAGIALARKTLMKRFRALSVERREAGDLDQIEAQLAQLAYAEAALLHAQAAKARITAEQELLRVIGTMNTIPPLPENYQSVSITETDVKATLSALPSVRAAQARIATAQATVRLRERERRPDPTVGFFAGREGDESLIGLRFSMPLPVRNSRRAEVDVAHAELEGIRFNVDDEYRFLRSELVAAAKRYELSRQAWEDWLQVGAGSLDRQTEILELLWRAGELSTAEYLVQLEQTLDTQIAAIEQRGVVWSDWITWLVVSGEIEDWLLLERSP